MRLIGCRKCIDVSICALQVDIDNRGLLAEAESGTVGIGLDLCPVFARRHFGGLHDGHIVLPFKSGDRVL